MSHRRIAPVVLVAVLVLLSALVAGQTQAAPSAPDALTLQATSAGSVRVIVGLALPLSTQALTDADSQAEQARIAGAQDAVLKQLAGHLRGSARKFQHVPFVALETDAAGLAALRAFAGVSSVQEDHLNQADLMDTDRITGAASAWSAGYSGAGQTVAILDTGVDRNHPFLAGKVVSEACFSTTSAANGSTPLCPNGQDSQTGTGAGQSCSGDGGCQHGTHVAGIVAGKSTSFSGMARDAKLIAVQVFSRFPNGISAYDSDIIAGMERVYNLRGSYKIASVNMSLGGASYTSAAACDAANGGTKAVIDKLKSAGIAVVIAAGNSGRTNEISAPACISSAISVGATEKSNAVASYSNSASFLKLLAPGSSIYSSIPGGGYAYFSGTSMATPHVAGAWAVLKQKLPSASVDQLTTALQSSGYRVTDSRNGTVKSRIQIDAALTRIGGTAPTPTRPAPTRTPTRPAPTATPAPSAYCQRVNAGGGTYAGFDGQVWTADRPYSAGSWGYVGGAIWSTTQPIANTLVDAIFQSERVWNNANPAGYRFTVPNGTYEVRLKFAENYWSAANKRKFDVRIEGIRVLTAYDIFASAGARFTMAADQVFVVNVSDGVLTIDFGQLAGFDRPKINALKVTRQ